MSDEQNAAPAPKMVRIKVDPIFDPAQARKDSSFSLADLSSAQQEQPALRVHYGELKAKAERQVNDLKLKLEAAESAVYRQVRDELTKQNIKITEALLDREVNAHKTILAIKLAINEAKQILDVLKAVYDAFEDRKMMVVSASAKDRAELEVEMRMGASQAVKNNAQEMLAKRNAAAGIA